MTALFTTDEQSDYDGASDGVSRYGVYVRNRIPDLFSELWDGTYETLLRERFARLAWYTATSPVMAPPYVTWAHPVLSVDFAADEDDGTSGLVATVAVAVSTLPLLGGSVLVGRTSWWGWPQDLSLSGEWGVRSPRPDEVNRGSQYALTTTQLVFSVAAHLLPNVPRAGYTAGKVEDCARIAVAALVTELNRVVSPLTERLGSAS